MLNTRIQTWDNKKNSLRHKEVLFPSNKTRLFSLTSQEFKTVTNKIKECIYECSKLIWIERIIMFCKEWTAGKYSTLFSTYLFLNWFGVIQLKNILMFVLNFSSSFCLNIILMKIILLYSWLQVILGPDTKIPNKLTWAWVRPAIVYLNWHSLPNIIPQNTPKWKQ